MTYRLDKNDKGLYSVVFNVTNNLTVDLRLSRFRCAYKMRYSFNENRKNYPTAAFRGARELLRGKTSVFAFVDIDLFFGAEGIVDFVAEVGGQRRKYSWWGYCPSSASILDTNAATGPGIEGGVPHGAPLILNIEIDDEVAGWTHYSANPGPEPAAQLS